MKISSKPYKQWCKARNIDFQSYMEKFPEVSVLLEGQHLFSIKNKTQPKPIKEALK